MVKCLDELEQGFKGRFWVGERHGEVFVYDAFEQVATPEIVHLWSIQTRRMGSYKAVFMRVDMEPLKDVTRRADAISFYQNQCENRVQTAEKERALSNFYNHPRTDTLSNLFEGTSDNGDCFPPHERLLLDAKRNRPRQPEATASAFAQWVYELYHKKDPYLRNAASEKTETIAQQFYMAMGTFTEQSIEDLKLWINHRFPRSMSHQWRVIFVDTRQEPYRLFQASRLCVNGQPLRCVPDVVLQNKLTKDVLIIERKATSVPEEKIPAMGWANLKAQLWCYSWIDDWIDAPNVYLIGQIWKMPEYINLFGYRELSGFWRLNIYPRWQRNDPHFLASCQALFLLYGGEVLE